VSSTILIPHRLYPLSRGIINITPGSVNRRAVSPRSAGRRQDAAVGRTCRISHSLWSDSDSAATSFALLLNATPLPSAFPSEPRHRQRLVRRGRPPQLPLGRRTLVGRRARRTPGRGSRASSVEENKSSLRRSSRIASAFRHLQSPGARVAWALVDSRSAGLRRLSPLERVWAG
jgi:hypothetical protein